MKLMPLLDPEEFKRLIHHPDAVPTIPAGASMARAREEIQMCLPGIMDMRGITLSEAMDVLRGWYENDFRSPKFGIRCLAAVRLLVLDEMSEELLDAKTALEMN